MCSPFGIPFPASRNPQAWQEWHKRVRAQLEARRNTRARANASGTGSSGIIETHRRRCAVSEAGKSLKTGLGQIQGIAEDSSGNLYVASCDLGAVLKIDSASNTTVYAGQPLATGPAALDGRWRPRYLGKAGVPLWSRTRYDGQLVHLGYELGTVRVVDAATGVIQTIAGTPGQRDYGGNGGDGGPATAATLGSPTGLALDGNGDLFIEDGGFIRKVNLTTGVIQSIAGGVPSPVPCALSATTTCPAAQSLTLR